VLDDDQFPLGDTRPPIVTGRDEARRSSRAWLYGMPLTATGVELPLVVPFPSCPLALSPQQSMASGSSAHVWVLPAAIVVALAIPVTCTGVELHEPPQSGPVVVPFPSSPLAFWPQQSMLPPVSSAQASPPPAVAAMAFVIPLTATGVGVHCTPTQMSTGCAHTRMVRKGFQ
jgi:hypothetical protein